MKARDLFDLLMLAAVWGGSFLFLRVASPEVGPLGVAACRVTGGALLLMPLVAWRGQLGTWRGHGPQLAIAGVLSTILPFIGFSQASRSLPAGLLSILNATAPMWAALIGWLWSREQLAPMRALGLALGFAGVALLAADSTQLHTDGAYAAVGMALGSTLMYAIAVHFNKRYLSHLSALSVSAGTLGSASLMLMLPAWWIGPQPSQASSHTASRMLAGHTAAWSDVPALAWWAVLALTVLCTGVAYVVFYRLIDRIGPSRALTVTFLIPVFGMLWGSLFLGEHVSMLMLISTGVILLGTWLSNHGKAPAPSAKLQAART